MLLTLIKALATNDLDIIVANIELPPIDIDVMLYEAQENSEIEIDKEKNTIKALKEPEYLYSNPKTLRKDNKTNSLLRWAKG